MPFIDSAELAGILGEPHATVHRSLTGLLADGILGRVSHGTAHLPSSHRYYLAANAIREAAGILGFETSSDFVRAYPVSREWLALLIRRMDAVASVYRLTATLSPGVDGLRSHEEVEATYVRTAARISRMSLPVLVSCRPVLSTTGILGRSWHPVWEPESPRLPLSGLRAYQWDSLYHRMRHRPVEGNR